MMGWYILGALIALGLFFLSISPQIGFGLIGFAGTLFWAVFTAIEYPDFGLLYRRGKYSGRLGPGWYVPLPYFQKIVTVSGKEHVVPTEGSLYIKGRKGRTTEPVYVKATLVLRADPDQANKLIFMPPEGMLGFAPDALFSGARRQMGPKTLAEITSTQHDIEKAILLELKDECERYGYIASDVEIHDIKDEPEEIRAKGIARGDAARALSAPLKDNLPASYVNIAMVLMDGLKEIMPMIMGAKKKLFGAKKDEKDIFEEAAKKFIETTERRS